MSSLLDEFIKTAAAKDRFRIPQARSGRRPMSVETLLRKEKDGSLFKDMKVAAWKDQLPGGLADKKKPSDFPASALRQGQKVESEHTKNKTLATEIAMDHLTEDARYYPKLRKMEKEGESCSPFLLGSSGAMQLNGATAPEIDRERMAQSKRRPGDVPSMDEVPTYPTSSVASPTTKSVDLAVKVSGLERPMKKTAFGLSPQLASLGRRALVGAGAGAAGGAALGAASADSGHRFRGAVEGALGGAAVGGVAGAAVHAVRSPGAAQLRPARAVPGLPAHVPPRSVPASVSAPAAPPAPTGGPLSGVRTRAVIAPDAYSPTMASTAPASAVPRAPASSPLHVGDVDSALAAHEQRAGERLRSAYGNLDPSLKRMISEHPHMEQMRRLGMTDEQAYLLMDMSARQKRMGIGQFLLQERMGAPSAASSSLHGAATFAPSRMTASTFAPGAGAPTAATFGKLSSGSMLNELEKLCAIRVPRALQYNYKNPYSSEIEESQGRLKSLAQGYRPGEAVRAGALGAVAVPALSIGADLIKGKAPNIKYKGIGKALAGAVKGEVEKGSFGRRVASDAAKGAIGGSLVPMARNRLERGAEAHRLESLKRKSEAA